MVTRPYLVLVFALCSTVIISGMAFLEAASETTSKLESVEADTISAREIGGDLEAGDESKDIL